MSPMDRQQFEKTLHQLGISEEKFKTLATEQWQALAKSFIAAITNEDEKPKWQRFFTALETKEARVGFAPEPERYQHLMALATPAEPTAQKFLCIKGETFDTYEMTGSSAQIIGAYNAFMRGKYGADATLPQPKEFEFKTEEEFKASTFYKDLPEKERNALEGVKFPMKITQLTFDNQKDADAFTKTLQDQNLIGKSPLSVSETAPTPTSTAGPRPA